MEVNEQQNVQEEACVEGRGQLICPTCKEPKEVTDFYAAKSKSTGRTYRCKACTLNANRDYYNANREKERERAKANRAKWREEHKEEIEARKAAKAKARAERRNKAAAKIKAVAKA